QPGTLDQAGHFGPYHAWIHGSLADPRTEATVGPSDDTFAAYQPRVGAEALRHHLRVFYIVGFRLDHTGDKDLILRQLHLLEELPFVGVARVGGFEGDPVWPGCKDDVDDVRQRHIVVVRTLVVAPAQMQAQLVRRNIGQGMIERLD